MFTTELFILVMINHKMKYDDNKSGCQRMICKKLKHDSHIKIQWTRVKDLFNSLIHWRNKQDSKASSKKDLNICVVTGKKKESWNQMHNWLILKKAINCITFGILFSARQKSLSSSLAKVIYNLPVLDRLICNFTEAGPSRIRQPVEP